MTQKVISPEDMVELVKFVTTEVDYFNATMKNIVSYIDENTGDSDSFDAICEATFRLLYNLDDYVNSLDGEAVH